MLFTCEPCGYSTDVKFCFQKHLSSNRHREKVSQSNNKTLLKLQGHSNETYKCCFCEQTCSTASSLARHKRKCTEKKNLESNYTTQIETIQNKHLQEIDKLHSLQHLEIQKLLTEIDKLKMNIEHLKELSEKDESTIENLRAENRYLKLMVSNAGNIIKSSVSSLSYVVKHYQDAPPLKSIDDYSKLTYDRQLTEEEDDYEDNDVIIDGDNIFKRPDFIDKDDIHSDDSESIDDYTEIAEIDNKERFINELVLCYEKQSIDKYLGDIIIKTYKKDDPAKQSIWNSDTNRLTYVIRELLNNNNKIDWTVDKKGIKTTNYIIKPLLEHIEDVLRDYLSEKANIDENTDINDYEKSLKKMHSVATIIRSIEKNELAENILKYIAPHFYLSKTEEPLPIDK